MGEQRNSTDRFADELHEVVCLCFVPRAWPDGLVRSPSGHLIALRPAVPEHGVALGLGGAVIACLAATATVLLFRGRTNRGGPPGSTSPPTDVPAPGALARAEKGQGGGIACRRRLPERRCGDAEPPGQLRKRRRCVTRSQALRRHRVRRRVHRPAGLDRSRPGRPGRRSIQASMASASGARKGGFPTLAERSPISA